MKKIFVIGCLLYLFAIDLQAQGIIEEQSKTLFSNERTIGINLNSNGMGAGYRYARYIDFRNRWYYDIDFDYIKHPKEYKTVVLYPFYTRRYVFGKENLFWETKGYIGRQRELYRKYDKNSLSIRLFYSGGLSLGFQKPIYYEILSFNSALEIINREEKLFDPAIHQYNYGGTASFLKGLDEVKVIPGLAVKAGFTFEYSQREPVIHALETGIGFTVYPVPISIMATEENSYLFFRMFVGYRFGNIVDISEAARAKTRKEKREDRMDAIR